MQKSPAVLIVEDDEMMQSMIGEFLTQEGFELAVVNTAEEAITLLRSRQDEYRALVSDINLAGELDGWDVARVAREIDPEFPVVYMTGGAASERSSKAVLNSILLSKPFTLSQLVTAVSLLLSGSA